MEDGAPRSNPNRYAKRPTTSGRVRICLGIVLSLLACAPQRDNPPPNLFIVLVDTLRADRVDTSGETRSLTPVLDSLANTSTVFHNAYSTSSWTSPAVASLFTSRYPSQHGVLEFDSALPAAEVTLAEILKQRGYQSGGFSSNLLIGDSRGFQQGFQLFRTQGLRTINGMANAERTSSTGKRAMDWIDSLPKDPGAPIFVYLHVIDPHAPYAPDSNAMGRVFGKRPRPNVDRVNAVMQTHITNEIPEDTRREVRGLYDAEVSSMDTGLGHFFSELAARNLLQNSIVVVTSDHGEELWDHDMFGHHHSLYEEVLRVPVLIRLPGQTSRRDVVEEISLVDIAPTLIDLLRDAPVAAFEGRSLVPWMSTDSEIGSDGPSVPDSRGATRSTGVVSELIVPPILRRTSHERTVILGSKQLIRDFDGTEHFIDLAESAEDRPGGGISDEEKHVLRDRLDRFVAHVSLDSQSGESDDRVILDQKSREELRTLGYIE
jgi:arylsulfatase A-like enzyme